jgi:O-antigen/teichoic acid export membrane protein
LLCQFKYATALPGDLISYLGQALAVLILARRGELTLNTAFASMAISSASACILQSIQVGLAKVKIAELQTLAADFWSFGRWNMYSNVTTLFTDFSFNWVLAARCGLDASAAFQIAGNLLKPCNVVMIAIPGVAVPAAARARRTGGFEAAWKAMRHYLALGALVMIPYLMFLAVWPEGVMRVLYHHNAARYFPYANYARLNIVWLVALYFANSLGNFLAALEETRYQFISSFINILAVLAIGLPLTVFWGVPGAIAGWILCIVARGICNLIFLSRVKKQPDDLPDPVPMVSPAIAIGN